LLRISWSTMLRRTVAADTAAARIALRMTYITG
jgi:hypothetical protein